MAPAPMPIPTGIGGGGGAWHEEQIDELFASLLGKGCIADDEREKEGEEVGNGMDVDVKEALKGGF